MNPNDDRQIEVLLRHELDDEVPAEVEQQMRRHLVNLRHNIAAFTEAPSRRGRHVLIRVGRRAGAVAAACLLACVAWWYVGGHAAYGEVARLLDKDTSKLHVLARVDDRLVAQLVRFYEAYGLKAGENLKLIVPPFIPERATYYRWHTAAFMTSVPEMDLMLSRQPDRMVFQWSEDILKRSGESYGQLPFHRVLMDTLGTGRGRIEGNEEVLSRAFAADVVFRPEASVEERAENLNHVLHEELDWPVHLSFQELRRPVIVVSGTYEYHPLPGPRLQQQLDEVQIRGIRERKVITSGGGGSGDLAEFLERVSDYIGRPVVAGWVSGAPEKLLWLTCPRPRGLRLPDDELTLVLQHLTDQTGLAFDKKDREVQVLVVQE